MSIPLPHGTEFVYSVLDAYRELRAAEHALGNVLVLFIEDPAFREELFTVREQVSSLRSRILHWAAILPEGK